jgi:hypothetical protein
MGAYPSERLAALSTELGLGDERGIELLRALELGADLGPQVVTIRQVRSARPGVFPAPAAGAVIPRSSRHATTGRAAAAAGAETRVRA